MQEKYYAIKVEDLNRVKELLEAIQSPVVVYEYDTISLQQQVIDLSRIKSNKALELIKDLQEVVLETEEDGGAALEEAKNIAANVDHPETQPPPSSIAPVNNKHKSKNVKKNPGVALPA
jgi:hypothetical protein